MENKTYRVELTPIGNYYFGSENTFNSSDKGDNSKVSVNYLVRSRMYPQQTALLGLMRYILLLKGNALQGTPSEKEKLIGKKSFQGTEDKTTVGWGQIVSLSPLFLQKAENQYIIAGHDCQFYNLNDKEQLIKLETERKQDVAVSYSKKPVSLLTDYDPKQYTHLLWKNAEDENEFLKPDDIFKETFQVGITKSFNGGSNNDAFYKQYFYTLKNDFSFAFYLTTKDPIKDAGKPVIAPFGADQSLFRIKFLEEENQLFLKQEPPAGNVKITLLSDAYCLPHILNSCYLSITNSVDFRYIKTDVAITKRYYNVSVKADDMQKSAKLNLLERGSILYSEDATNIFAELENKYPAYRNIGFNYYSIQLLTSK